MKKMTDIIWYNELDSTNLQAIRDKENVDKMSVIAAKHQTAGKGQGDHIWLSPADENLMFTITLKYGPEGFMDNINVSNEVLISHVTAITVTQVLAAHGIDSRVKLPNDIYVGMKKICGILIKHTLKGKYLTDSIIGIGLNVNQTVFDPNLPNPTSMKIESKENYNIDSLLNEFLGLFVQNMFHMEEVSRALPELLLKVQKP